LPKGCSHGKLLTWLYLILAVLLVNDLEAVTLPGYPQTIPDTSDQARPNEPFPDTIASDTLTLSDTLADKAVARTSIDAMIDRFARDSIVQNLAERKVYLYGASVIKYENITLKAEIIEVDFNTNMVYARGREDSTGKLIGAPEFTEGDQTFKAKVMSYNFDTKRGMIKEVLTEDNQGFLHGQRVKKMDDNTINILHGSYTTCSLEENPHFQFKFKKSRVIPDNKIVTGPAYMEIEGVPTVLALPFGIFPNNQGKKSGIIIPSYGESPNRGFFLENGGYYWAINDYMDFTILGDIYSRGSWAVKPSFSYRKRYKFNGYVNLGFAQNVVSTPESPDYEKSSDFRVRWVFSQDPKARPRSTFSADVNIVTSNYVRYNVVSSEDYLSNEFQSSIAYQTNWAGKYFLTLNSTFRQNTKTKQVNISLPQLTFTINRFFPLRRTGGKKRVYEDLALSYNMNARNSLETTDSVLFGGEFDFRDLQNGAIHKVPVSLPMKVLKYFTLSNSLNITDRMYSQTSRLSWVNDTIIEGDTIEGYTHVDTIVGFANAIDFSVSSNLTTRIYGMLQFKGGPLRAIRHVMTPSVGISYTPDFGNEFWGYYDTYIDGDGNEVKYSRFDNNYLRSIYGSPPGQESGRVNVSIANVLEIKVRSRKDTVTGMKKVKLLEAFNINWSYDLAKDSLNMSNLNLSARTTIWKGVTIQYSSSFNPYAADSLGRSIDTYQWTVDRSLFRRENTYWNLSVGLQFGDEDFKKKKKEAPEETSEDLVEDIMDNQQDFVDWSVPWSVDLRYNFQYRTNLSYLYFEQQKESNVVQTLSLSGQVNITPKWKFTFRTGWDFTNNDVSYTSINIYRDLHCWEMRFNWVPLGPRKSWNFSINVKASILQDLKLSRKKDFRDI
jgi:lipopolysaccharide assembly outer membrane protein LptD (OstA)